MSETTKKSIVYVDVNDEITAIISKLEDAPAKIVAVVLPKRAPVFQSIINVKLLKKAADTARKKTVLITTDKSVLPLAGTAGLHVARTTESKPYIPDAPVAHGSNVDPEADLNPEASVGDLARKANDKNDAIDLGDLPDLALDESDTPPTKKSNRPKVKVPNFNKFRLMIVLAIIGLILLVVGWYVAAFVLPRAEITVETSSQNIAEVIEFDIALDQDAVDAEAGRLPAVQQTYAFEDDATIDTTGEVNVGDRASGEVSVTNCETAEDESLTIPEGAELIAANGRVFLATESVEVPGSGISGTTANPSCDGDGRAQVPVQAAEVGTNHNIGPNDYTVEGYSPNSVFGTGGAMTGGTDQIESAVASRDIRTGEEQLSQRSTPAAELELVEQFEVAGLLAIPESFQTGERVVASSHDEGEQVDEITVSLTTEYTMLGVAREDIRQLIEAELADEFDFSRQAIVDDGLETATLRLVSSDDDGARIRLRTIIAIGPDIDIAELKAEIGGLSRSETERIIFLQEGVRNVEIDYTPFWVFATPNNQDRIDLRVIQPGDHAESIDETDSAEPDDEADSEDDS